MTERVVIVGGGAAGMFAAIACAADRRKDVLVLEAGTGLLRKVKLSGGGRCNFTHACSDIRTFAAAYPRGGKALIGPLHRFGSAQTLAWFAGQGVEHVCEPDGRIFPASQLSQTIVDALVHAARAEGVQWRLRAPVCEVEARPGGGFRLTLENGEPMECEKLLIATGGEGNGEKLARMLGHTFVEPVPSLFAFHIQEPWLRVLAGLGLENVKARIPGTRWRESGALVVTHWGLSGPAVLKLSAWAARDLHDCAYRFPLEIDWLPEPTSWVLSGGSHPRDIFELRTFWA